MEKERYHRKRVCSIRVEPYLAEYARKKFDVDPKSGGIKIPYTYDLYHCIWNRMEKPPIGAADVEGANLKIFLPCRRTGADGLPRKHPEYWNYLSPTSALEVETCLRQLFNFDFHQQMMDNEHLGRPRQQAEVVEWFLSRYGIRSLTSSALLKNFQRYRQRISPRKPRKYQKVASI